MSRLRFPFRQSSSAAVPTLEATKEIPTTPIVVVEEDTDPFKGKTREDERLWGLENFGNTCYCNSVLQALYACDPFKQFVESYPDVPAAIWPMAPPPGTADKPKPPAISDSRPGSPLALTKGNPFDNPNLLNGTTPTSPIADGKKKGLFGRRSTSSAAPPSLASIQQGQQSTPTRAAPPTPPPEELPVNFDPNAPQPTMFETIQTLFHHLSSSNPHQPLPPRKEKSGSVENAQTASILPPTANGGPQPSLTTSNSKEPAIPPGPPLLASLPPPSAPRGGGPYQAGMLGRGVVRPEDLMRTVRNENEMFRGLAQQDAHEFLGWVLNKVAEDVEMVDRSLRGVGKEVTEQKGHGKTFVQNLFEGVLTNETRCLSCESTSSRDELFLDLSIDIEQHTSVTACLRQFSASEMLCAKNKFHCDSCCGLQEAEKRMKIKRLPNVLALHLKRFKYQEDLGRYAKLFYRVPFPTQLRLPNTSDDTEDPDRLYELFAVVVHIGNGPTHGHYVCIVRSAGRWVMCDDENVEPIDDADIFRYFGDFPSGAGYVLFYQAVDLDLTSLGLKRPATPPTPVSPVRSPVPSQGGQGLSLMDIDEEYTGSASRPLVSPPEEISPRTAQTPQQANPLPIAVAAPLSPPTSPTPAIRQPALPPTNKVQTPTRGMSANGNTPQSTTFGGLGVNVPNAMLIDGHEGVSGTPTPTPPRQPSYTGQKTNGVAQSPPMQLQPPIQSPPLPSSQAQSLGLGRKPSSAMPKDRERTLSSSSDKDKDRSASASGGGGGSSKDGQGSLSRRLSGMGKLTKSGSMKFGFGMGKKDKS